MEQGAAIESAGSNGVILRITGRMADKISEKPGKCVPRHDNPLADWAAHLFRAERTEYVIVTNCASLYTVAFYGRGTTHGAALITRFLSNLRDAMDGEFGEAAYEERIVPHTDRVLFSKVGDRRVQGSMTDQSSLVKYWVTHEDLAPCDMADRLNGVPMGMLGSGVPRDAFRECLLKDSRQAAR